MLLKLNNRKNSEPFPNGEWRNFISGVCRNIDKNQLGLQIISPFGFELLEEKIFLHKSIKRLYCYIGVPSKNAHACDLLGVANLFFDELMSSIADIGIDPSDIAILAVQDKFKFFHDSDYLCKPSDKLIDVQAKIIYADIFHDYADYIICTVDSICSKKEEPEHFFENKRHRCRTFQLYVMLEKIFGYLLPPMSDFQRKNFRDLFGLIDNSIQIFYTPSKLLVDASDYEVHLLTSLITPRVTLMRQEIRSESHSGELMKLQCNAYHVDGKLELMINKNIYENAVNKITSTYLNYV